MPTSGLCAQFELLEFFFRVFVRFTCWTSAAQRRNFRAFNVARSPTVRDS